jgi:stearoyl-CoA desaturase (delta-9 desaturase)
MLIIIVVAIATAFLASQLSSYSTTIFLHRCMAHKGLKLHPVIAWAMQVQLWLFTGIVTREWVAVHRKHHHFTDDEGDPHSPYLKGLWSVLLLNAYYYAREAQKPDVVQKYTRDIPHTRAEKVLGRGWLGLTLGLSLFAGLFSLFVPHWWGPVLGVAVFIAQGVTYVGLSAVINGACHAIGYRNFNNTATNLRIVAWITGGEGLHNNHHQYPAASKFSMNWKRFEIDPAWLVIKALTWMKLAQPLPLPKIEFSFSQAAS